MLTDRRARAVAALAGGVVVATAPGLLARRSGHGIGPSEVVRVELAGSGGALRQAAGGSPDALATHRRLAMLDNAYVAAYALALLLGSSLLPPGGRRAGVGLTLLAAGSDLVENAALVRALGQLQVAPGTPGAADRCARVARRAALVKFAALIPAAALAAAGAAAPLRSDPVAG